VKVDVAIIAETAGLVKVDPRFLLRFDIARVLYYAEAIGER
jgi:hypothetical protein